MKKVTNWLQTVGLRQIITVLLVTLAFMVIPVFNQSASLQVQAAELRNPGEYNPVTPDTVKRIQEKAQDLGDAPGRRIGDTGLENIKQLPESIPNTIDLNIRQQSAKYNSDEPDKVGAMEKAQDKVEAKR